ncbi:MAG: helix-turn-helix transcriptional regulator [Janthinobacterium lividum]
MKRTSRREVRSGALPASIDRFYEAAGNPALWQMALQQFSDATGAEGSLLLFHEAVARPRYLCSAGLAGSIDAFFAAGWHERNAAIQRGRLLAQRGIEVQTEWLLFDAEEYRRDPFHQEFLRPHGFAWFAGVFVAQSASSALTLSPQRRSQDEPFAKSELEAIARMLPHLRRAGSLALAFSESRAVGSLDALACLDLPAFLLDRSGRVCRTNAMASEVLGAGLSLVRGHLATMSPASNAALRGLIHGLITPGSAGLAGPVSVPRAFGQPLVVSGMPLVGTAQDVFSHGAAVLTVFDPGRGHMGAEHVLQQACGLTRAEAATARALADGLDLAEVAAQRNVGIETIRSQTKSIGAKTGARGRGKLVALLSRILAATPRG